jgi:phage-related protein
VHVVHAWLVQNRERLHLRGQNGWFDKDGNRVDDPSQDVCSGLLSTGCKPRFGENEQLDYGGFPALHF